jgi:hypothetical protein
VYRVEIRPGVVYDIEARSIPADLCPRLRRGAVVRLLGGADGAVTIALAQADEESYVGEAGRPAIVLPKSRLLRGDSRPDPTQPRRGFVTAGLPALETTPTSEPR